jgi:hypothetical protein
LFLGSFQAHYVKEGVQELLEKLTRYFAFGITILLPML